MLNHNGELLPFDYVKITFDNRAFNYGDAVFETIKVINDKVIFWEEHYFRLMASMRMLRMQIPIEFTLEFLEQEILKTVEATSFKTNARVKLSVYRKDGGFYRPSTNQINYLIKANTIDSKQLDSYRIDLYKDFYVYSGHLSTIKSNNKLVNILASIFADENALDNCILLNERKKIVEATNANLFLIKNNTIKTPALTEGCLKGVIRGKIIEIISKTPDYSLEETTITPFEIQKADEVFITNSIIGIQPVTHYRKKEFKTEISNKLSASLKILEITAK